jgi:hypothetical protein
LVVGVARENNAHELKANGADCVVTDLSEVTVETLDQWVAATRKESKPLAD